MPRFSRSARRPRIRCTRAVLAAIPRTFAASADPCRHSRPAPRTHVAAATTLRARRPSRTNHRRHSVGAVPPGIVRAAEPVQEHAAVLAQMRSGQVDRHLVDEVPGVVIGVHVAPPFQRPRERLLRELLTGAGIPGDERSGPRDLLEMGMEEGVELHPRLDRTFLETHLDLHLTLVRLSGRDRLQVERGLDDHDASRQFGSGLRILDAGHGPVSDGSEIARVRLRRTRPTVLSGFVSRYSGALSSSRSAHRSPRPLRDIESKETH